MIDDTLATFLPIGAPPTWALSSHDEVRLVTRFGRATTSAAHFSEGAGEASDPVLGTRRARAAALVMLALPGSAYLYQGEELGLPEVLDLPDEALQDPIFSALRRGEPGAGRLPGAAAVARRRSAVRILSRRRADVAAAACGLGGPHGGGAGGGSRLDALSSPGGAAHPAIGSGARAGSSFAWLDAPEGVLAFARGAGFRCVVNLSDAPVPTGDGEVLLASGPLADGLLPIDTAAWIRSEPPTS